MKRITCLLGRLVVLCLMAKNVSKAIARATTQSDVLCNLLRFDSNSAPLAGKDSINYKPPELVAAMASIS